MNLKKRRLAILTGFFLIVLFSIGLYKVIPWVHFAGAQIVPPSATLEAGRSTQLSTLAWGSDGEFYNIPPHNWQSSDTSIARVSQEGVVTAVQPGTTQIIVKVNNKTVKATVEVVASNTP